jgi:valyl-tRNA synthetase
MAIEALARARPVTIREYRRAMPSGEKVLALVLKESEVVIPMASMVDVEAERKRLQAEIDEVQGEIARLETLLGSSAFVTRAPAAVVEKEQGKLGVAKDKLVRLKQELNRFEA